MKYDSGFFGWQAAGSASSAEVVVPLVLSLFSTQSVVDVGCGVGTWLKEFERRGVRDYLGLDGPYILESQLRIPPERFRIFDLTRLTSLGRTFDLACSLEVAEHLDSTSGPALIAALCDAAPVVLFSAAIPNQGGIHHVNERWQSYWANLFKQNGFVAIDCVRPVVYGEERVDWWYRQNILVYCRPERCPANHSPISQPYELNRVDPGMVEALVAPPRPKSGTEAVALLRQSGSNILRSLPTLARATALLAKRRLLPKAP